VINRLQQRFIDEYLADSQKNAAAAARRAGYSPKVAKVVGSRILKKPEVQKSINDRLAAIRHNLGIAAEQVVINEQLVLSGLLRSIEDARAAGVGAWQMQAIQRGYEMLGRYLGMFKDQIEIGLDAQIIAQLESGRQRARELTEPEEEAPNEEKKDGADKPN
jgi:hypothetical protein